MLGSVPLCLARRLSAGSWNTTPRGQRMERKERYLGRRPKRKEPGRTTGPRKQTSDPKQEGPRPARTGRREPTTEKHHFLPMLGSWVGALVCCRYLGRRPVKELEPSSDNQSLSLQKLLAFDNQPGGQRRSTQVSSSVSTRKQLLPKGRSRRFNTAAGIIVLHMARASAALKLPTG